MPFPLPDDPTYPEAEVGEGVPLHRGRWHNQEFKTDGVSIVCCGKETSSTNLMRNIYYKMLEKFLLYM